nr:putative ABC transporter ATP-binding protein [bacterium BMS3Abin05]GBE27149.1 putative ABC transporter ATP-binding protein [bacterium BMS3Bbin03]HDL78474.1 ATP-binding cassette domain-containing protein [Bacteroidota bacterium]HDZ11595.1 ATP-binding cassette domain-containing protein [Bacteroidota bacterium]
MIILKNIHKRFGSKRVLDGVNLTLEEKRITTIIGMSGTGKSVLLKHIIGLLKPDAGDIFVDEMPIARMREEELNRKVRIKMSMVFQEAALWDSLTIFENIALALRIHKHLTSPEIARLIHENLELVDLRDIENAYPIELSGGMKKRVGIARAIAIRPKYLLYDEPTTGLDPINASIINKLIVRLNRELSITSIVITHDIGSVSKIADRIAMLDNGKIIVDIAKEQMWTHDDPTYINFIKGHIGVIP